MFFCSGGLRPSQNYNDFHIRSAPLQGHVNQRTSWFDINHRAGGIRTHDLLNPIQAHYQAVLRPDLEGEVFTKERQISSGQVPLLFECRLPKNSTETNREIREN